MGTLISNTGLMAPLDVVRFILAYVVLVVVPGYALAALARPRTDHVERLALAVPCAYALVAISGLATALLHLPFGLPSYAAFALPVTVAGGYSAWRRRSAVPVDAGRWWLAALGAGIGQVGVLALVYGRDIVPTSSDVVSHTIWTNLIARAHVFPIALQSAHIGANDGAFYPPVFHALTSLLHAVAPMATYQAVFLNVVAAIAFLPLALFTYVRTATGSSRLAGLAALLSLGFEPLPFFIFSLGFYPLIVALLCVPALAMTLRDGLGHGDVRAVALAAALGVGLFYTHPTEFVTAALLTLALLPSVQREQWSWPRACSCGAIVAAAWALAAFPALRAVHATMAGGAQAQIRSGHTFAPAAQVDVPGVLHAYLYWVYGLNVSYPLLVAVIAGIAWCLARRRWLGLVAAQAILCAVFIDANSVDLLQRLYVLSYPWALFDRLAATHYWVVLPLAAIGLDALARLAWRRLRSVDAAFVALVATPVVVLGLALPLVITSGRAAAYDRAHNSVAPADLAAIAWLARHAPAGSAVANDAELGTRPNSFDVPIDAGLWMPALDGPQPLFWRDGMGPGSFDDRVYLLQHIADVPLPPRAARFVARYHVAYVFYGAVVRPGSSRHLALARLLGDPRLRLVYSTDPRHSAARATRMGGIESYVFAIAPRREQ